jgi:hypothetical protein
MLGGASALLDPAKHFAQLYTTSISLSDPLQAFFFRCTWINVIAWGGAYILAGMMPGSRKAVLLAGGAGKLVYFVASVALFQSGAGKTMVITAGIVDVILATLFAVILLSSRKAQNFR